VTQRNKAVDAASPRLCGFKKYFPQIVQIFFADERKCSAIKSKICGRKYFPQIFADGASVY
jgi:hypothetical protein